MEYRNLGASGLKVSQLGLGTNSFGGRADKKTSIDIIHAALDHGITLIDTANGYTQGQSEQIIGEALKGRRSQAVIATKAGLPQGPGPYNRGTSRRHLTLQLEQSLKRLQTDFVDLFYVHTFDPDTSYEETVQTLDDFVRQGKVLYVACSNYRPQELASALGVARAHGWERFCGLQPSYSLLDRTPERELIPLAQSEGVGIVAYYPLAGGVLTGKYQGGHIPSGSRAERQPDFLARVSPALRTAGDRFADLAWQASYEPSALALAWLMDRPNVASAIVGATRVEQVLENLKALDVAIDGELDRQLDELSAPFVQGEPFGWYRLS
ncbi:MAG: aldo/keto reductase [Sulfobacillus acidophilus]|uniref:Aldo/keto reductase n=1 Tax=Sulfobacillus acidophilus TaxID=53633 RepID=A0A2T2WLV9_9FIRM|nr:MAG: aldo/keto reductase [Sulfobacillus acidophilus]